MVIRYSTSSETSKSQRARKVRIHSETQLHAPKIWASLKLAEKVVKMCHRVNHVCCAQEGEYYPEKLLHIPLWITTVLH